MFPAKFLLSGSPFRCNHRLQGWFLAFSRKPALTEISSFVNAYLHEILKIYRACLGISLVYDDI